MLAWGIDWALAAALAMVAGAAYWYTGWPYPAQQSSAPHFVLLADALLHGRLWIDPARAARLVDVTPFGGHLYVAFPPLPALLMLPGVALAGPGFNDALFTLAFGAANTGLAYLLVRRLSRAGWAGPGIPLGRAGAVAVAATLAFGTVHFYASLMGRVWFTAHIIAVTFLLLYLLECAGRGRPLVAGAALAAAFLSRPPVAFGALFWLVLAWRRRSSVWQLALRVAVFAGPGLLALALLLAQNAARFGSPFDFGYLSMRVSPTLAPDLRRYGQFNAHFLPRNLAALLLAPPVLTPAAQRQAWLRSVHGVSSIVEQWTRPPVRGRPPFPLQFDPWGTGLWAVSPVLAFTLRPPSAGHRMLALTSWASIILVAAPNLLYYNTGWGQFGYRFSLDWTPFWLILLALGLRRPLGRPLGVLFVVLLGLSGAMNLLGARWFLRLPPY